MKKNLFLFIASFTVNESIGQILNAEQIYKKVNDAVVQVYAYDSYSKIVSQGSGVVLNDKGWIVTNYHVYDGSEKLKIKHGGKEVEYSDIIGLDVDKDILILKISDNTFPYIKMGNSDALKVGQKVYAVGSPKGFENTISEGIISGLRSDEEHEKKYIQITAPISHGSSGGAVVNENGELVGISTLSLVEGQNINFAIPVNEVFKIYKKGGVNSNELLAANYFYKGLHAYTAGNYDKAIEYYKSALAIDPNNSVIYSNIACAKEEQHDYSGAILDINKAIELNPKDEEFFYNRGRLNYKQGYSQEAMDDFNQAIIIEPMMYASYYNRGCLKYKLKDYLGAIEDFNKTIFINPKLVMAYYNRGLSKIVFGQKESGCLDLNTAKELGHEKAFEMINKYCK